MSDERDSLASDAVLIMDPHQQAIREAENAIRQFDRVLDMIDDVVRAGHPFKLRPSKYLIFIDAPSKDCRRMPGTSGPRRLSLARVNTRRLMRF